VSLISTLKINVLVKLIMKYNLFIIRCVHGKNGFAERRERENFSWIYRSEK